MARPTLSDLSASYGVMDHDYVFWLGDLNYRIDLPLEETLTRAKSGTLDDMNYLLAYDQVRCHGARVLWVWVFGVPLLAVVCSSWLTTVLVV